MTLHLDLDGIQTQLRITGYYPSSQEDWTGEWCETAVSFRADAWLDYHRGGYEVFLCLEVDDILV